MTYPIQNSSQINMTALVATVDEAYADQKKDSRVQKQIQHSKKMDALNKNIGEFKKQEDKTSKAGIFQFFMGIGSTFFNLLSQIFTFVLPGVGPFVAQVINGALQGAIESASKLNPFEKSARKSTLKAEQHSMEAQNRDYAYGIEDERLQEIVASNQLVKKRMEESLANLEKGAEAAVATGVV